MCVVVDGFCWCVGLVIVGSVEVCVWIVLVVGGGLCGC